MDGVRVFLGLYRVFCICYLEFCWWILVRLFWFCLLGFYLRIYYWGYIFGWWGFRIFGGCRWVFGRGCFRGCGGCFFRLGWGWRLRRFGSGGSFGVVLGRVVFFLACVCGLFAGMRGGVGRILLIVGVRYLRFFVN